MGEVSSDLRYGRVEKGKKTTGADRGSNAGVLRIVENHTLVNTSRLSLLSLSHQARYLLLGKEGTGHLIRPADVLVPQCLFSDGKCVFLSGS